MTGEVRPRLSEDTHTNMRIKALQIKQQTGEQPSISALLTAAWSVASSHDDELLAALNMEAK